MLTGDPVLTIERPALEQLAALLLERVGLKITPDGYYGLRLALSSRMPALGISDAGEYVRRLRQAAGEHELRSLLPLVTVGKTDFFRDAKQFQAIELKVFPELLRTARREGRKAMVWSAGCATGEEPYSLAMVAMELSARPEEFDIWATDLNMAAVESAQQGRYPHRRIGGVSPARLQRFFMPCDGGYEVISDLRRYIRFEGQNLAAPTFPKVRSSSIDLILCRNVIIYFDLPTIRGLMDRFLQSLRPGGILLLGYSESLFRVYEKFEMFELEGTFAYRRPLEGPAPAPKPVRTGESSPKIFSPFAAARAAGAESPKVSADVKARLLAAAAPAPRRRPAGPSGSPVERLASAVELVDRGDFDKALSRLLKLTEDEPDDLASLLTFGNVCSLMGQAEKAREAFDRALAREPLCVEARVYGGIAAMQAGQLEEAKAELGKALFLEPTLALGHYLLAQVRERLGEHEAARRSYRNAIAQLKSPPRPLAGYYPDILDSADAIARAARYALAALEES